VDCLIEPLRKTLGVRVLVTAETHGGRERRLADIEEIEIYGPEGQRLSHPTGYPLTITLTDALSGDRLAQTGLRGPAVVAESRGAEALAAFADPGDGAARPLVTRRRFGRGMAFWVAVGEGSVPAGSPWWSALAQLAAGPPSVAWASPGRHRVILRRSGDRLLICAVDTQPDAPPVSLSLRVRRDVARPEGRARWRGEVAPVVGGTKVTRRLEGEELVVEFTPDPAETVLVR
jgi:hypothetical protein